MRFIRVGSGENMRETSRPVACVFLSRSLLLSDRPPLAAIGLRAPWPVAADPGPGLPLPVPAPGQRRAAVVHAVTGAFVSLFFKLNSVR